MPDKLGPWNAFELMGRDFPWPNPTGVSRELDRTVGESQWVPHVDIQEQPDAYLVKVDVPGVEPAKIAVSVDGNRLSISGTREPDTSSDDQTYRRRERSAGTFFRQFTLADNCDPGNVKATSNLGVLTVTIPKITEPAPRQIPVESL